MGIAFGKISVEMPAHKIVFEGDGYQVWKYPPAVAATVQADRINPQNPPKGNEFTNQGFRVLASYIGVIGEAKNVKRNAEAAESENIAMTAPVVMTPAAESEKVAMTAPVVMTPAPESEKVAMTAPVAMTPARAEESNASVATAPQSMSFWLPSKYTTVESAPVPTNPAVKIELVPERYEAVLSYSGNLQSNSEYPRQRADELLSKMKKDGLAPNAPFTMCGYNPPLTLPWMKRNEIHYGVDASEKFSE